MVPRASLTEEGPSGSREGRQKAESTCALFVLGIMRKSLVLRVVEHLKRLPRVVLESPSLETFQSHLDNAFLCNLL